MTDENGFRFKSYNDVPFMYRDEKDKKTYKVKMKVERTITVKAFDEEDAIREAIWSIDADEDDCSDIEVMRG